MQRKGHGGRPSKGERDQLISRAHPDVGYEVRVRAAQEGLSVSDYIAKTLAVCVGLPHLAPDSHPNQEELPIQRAS